MIHLILLLSSLLTLFLLPLAGADLVKNGRVYACILLPEKETPPPMQLAAEEISSYAEKITGRNLEIQKEGTPPRGKYRILLRVQKDPALGKEGYILRGGKDHLLITGSTPRAVLYGTYAFLEKYFGVRFLAPGELYESVPIRKELNVPDRIRICAKPEFSIRNVGFVSCNWNSDLKETWQYLIRNRWQVRGNPKLRSSRYCRGFARDYDRMDVTCSGGGHCLAKLIPDSLFESHPEYFALVKGKRIRQINEKGKAASQPCTSHPDVIELAAKGIIRYFDNAPPDSTYLLGNNDVPVWCECTKCTALDPPEEKKRKEVSTRFFTFIREVIRRVREKHPSARIRAWGYQNFRFAPRGIPPDPTLRINLCDHHRCYRHSLGDLSCTQNALFRKMFQSWRERNYPVTERGYQEVLLKSGYFYLPIEKVLAGDLRYFKSIGVDGYDYITSPPDGKYGKHFSPQKKEELKHAVYCLWPSLYVCGKMFWDTTLDPEKILEDAETHFYGKAYPVMKEYRKKLRLAYTETEGHILYNHPPVDLGRCLQKPGVEKELLTLLEKAEKLALEDPDRKVALRLALEKKYFLETFVRNARLYEKTQIFPRNGIRKTGTILLDGEMTEPDWKKTSYMTGHSYSPHTDLFVKVLFDEKDLYVSIAGSSPVSGEKVLLSFPDHNHPSLQIRTFDLGRKTPFPKIQKLRQGIFCYEVKLSRSLLGLPANAHALFLNVKRVRSARIAASLFPGETSSIALGSEGVKNGNFTHTAPKKKKARNILSENFPVHWSFTGKQSSWEKDSLSLNGTLYQFMSINGGPAGKTLFLETLCAPSGKGKSSIRPYLSLGKKMPFDKGKFTHNKRKYAPLTPVPRKAVYRFTFRLAPYELGYLYLRGNNVLVKNITLVSP